LSCGSIGVGVPQGSILGPLLFSLFVNDLPNVEDHFYVNMYADDTELHCSGDDLEQFKMIFNPTSAKFKLGCRLIDCS